MSKAYSGKYVEYNGNTYQLTPERKDFGCLGCAVMKLQEPCPDCLTQYCIQGYVYEEVIFPSQKEN